jgi:exodeoxyribonuclease III
MKPVSIYSWNLNGIRSAYRKGFLPWLEETQPDILCLQETRIHEKQRDHTFDSPLGYYAYWNDAERPGYSGTALFTKTPPISIRTGIKGDENDPEGRTQIIEYEDFIVINCYFPNGNTGQTRLDFKLKFYSDFVCELKNKKKPVIVCADVNTAHTEIDLAKPKANKGRSGFLEEERAWISEILNQGYIDTLRHKNPGKEGLYTWWAYRQGTKEKNSGWRFDYIHMHKDLKKNLIDAFTQPEINVSDHCPIGITLKNVSLNTSDKQVLPKTQQQNLL